MRIAAAILLPRSRWRRSAIRPRPRTARKPPTQIRVVPYSPLLRTEIVGVIGQPTTITFPPGESVYRVVQTGRPDKRAPWPMRAGKGRRRRRSRTRRSATT